MTGARRAVVVDNLDPEKRGRVKLAIPDLFFDPESGEVIDSPWADSKGGGVSGGWIDVPDVGTQVNVYVQHTSSGDGLELTYERGQHASGPDGKSTAPATSQGEDDLSVHMKVSAPFSVPAPSAALQRTSMSRVVTRESSADDRIDLQMPTSKNSGAYPHCRVMKTSGGFVLEVDDTPGSERLQLHHPSGASVEVSSQGTWVQRAAKRFDEVLEHDVRHVGGDARTRVDGHVLTGVGGNSVTDVTGRSVLLAGEVDVRSRFDLLMEVGGMFRQKNVGPVVQKMMSGWDVTCGQGVGISAAANLSLVSCLTATFAGGLGASISGGPTGVQVQSLGPAVVAAAGLLSLTSGGIATLSAGGAVNISSGAVTTVTSPAGGVPAPVLLSGAAFEAMIAAIVGHVHLGETPSAELAGLAATSADMASRALLA